MEEYKAERARDTSAMEAPNKIERLWFIDKNTGKKAVVTVEEVKDGRISFFYQGKRYTFSEHLLGTRVYVCQPDVQTVEELFYKGEYFRLEDALWISADGNIPGEAYQKRLSQLYRGRRRHYDHPVRELVAFARQQKNDAPGVSTAVRALEIALLKASAGEAKGFLPTFCSLYRRARMPTAALSLYNHVIEKYGSQIESPALLTSVSAAYMDIGNINEADRLRKKAFALGDGEDNKLMAFDKRFQAETRLE